MGLTRRGWLGATAGLAAGGGVFASGRAGARTAEGAGIIPPRPAPAFVVHERGAGTHDYGGALEALRAYALVEIEAMGLPGMTIGVSDLDGFTATLTLGWSDIENRVPVGETSLFQIGSISKSFIALTVLALADEGKIDLDGPAAHALPEAPWPDASFTVAQLLSHVTGLPADTPIFPRTPDGRLWSGFTPGSRFSYSNTGFQLLGRIIERATGEPHQAAAERLVRAKLGLAGMAGTISPERRPDFAVGYWPSDAFAADDLPGARLEHALWSPEDNPAGSIGASGGQMARYLRALMRIARGQGAPVLSDASARRFVTPVIDATEFGPGARYACGVAVVPLDGAPALHHTGGMMSFSSSFHADPAAGVACFASVNARMGPYRPRRTTAYAMRLLRAARTGARPPPSVDALAAYRVKDAEPFMGVFAGPDARFELSGSPGGLRLTTAEGSGAVAPGGPDRLVTDHPVLSRYGLDAVRENGKIVGFWWGEAFFSRDGARRAPGADPALAPMAGTYLNRDPWVGGADILVRGDRLVLEGGGPLVRHGDWWSAEKDLGGVERLTFEAPMNGRMTRLVASGCDMLRLTV